MGGKNLLDTIWWFWLGLKNGYGGGGILVLFSSP